MSGYDEMREMIPDINRQLMPCPFCGGGVYIVMVAYHNGPRFCINHRKRAPKGCPYHLGCNRLSFVDPRQALNEWNRRM